MTVIYYMKGVVTDIDEVESSGPWIPRDNMHSAQKWRRRKQVDDGEDAAKKFEE